VGVGDFEKKIPASACWKKSNPSTAASRKKMWQSYFIIPEGLYKIPAKPQPFWIICKPTSHSG